MNRLRLLLNILAEKRFSEDEELSDKLEVVTEVLKKHGCNVTFDGYSDYTHFDCDSLDEQLERFNFKNDEEAFEAMIFGDIYLSHEGQTNEDYYFEDPYVDYSWIQTV